MRRSRAPMVGDSVALWPATTPTILSRRQGRKRWAQWTGCAGGRERALEGECRRSTVAECEEGPAGWCRKAMLWMRSHQVREKWNEEKHDEDGPMLNPMSSSWHSLFQKHRGQFPVCDTVRPTMGWPQQPIQRAQVGHPLKSHLDPTPSWSHGGSVPVVPASLASNRHENHLHCCFRPRHDPPKNIPDLPSLTKTEKEPRALPHW